MKDVGVCEGYAKPKTTPSAALLGVAFYDYIIYYFILNNIFFIIQYTKI